LRSESRPGLGRSFRITGYVFSDVDVLFVRLPDGVHDGRGERFGPPGQRRLRHLWTDQSGS
jgi:hypothetical protein